MPDTPAPADDADIQDAVEGHRRFRQKFERDRAFFEALATARQKPRLLWIGCSDSRVVPAQITSADPGELFEVRNIANTVPPASSGDPSVGAAIEYAIGHLGIDDIVVCGHTGCGGLAALGAPGVRDGKGHLAAWVDYTRAAHTLMDAARVPEDERGLEVVKAHVQFQVDNLMTYPVVAAAVARGKLELHAWYYDMEQGRIIAYDADTGEWNAL